MGSTPGVVSDSWTLVCSEAEEGRGLGVCWCQHLNATPGEVLVGESEMSCAPLPFLKQGADVVLVNQTGSKSSHQASLAGDITDPSGRVTINTEAQHQTILDALLPPATFGHPVAVF